MWLPLQYAVKLAEVVTGRPVVAGGYGDPVYDLLVQAVPPAALSPQGVKKGHEMVRAAPGASGRRGIRAEGPGGVPALGTEEPGSWLAHQQRGRGLCEWRWPACLAGVCTDSLAA